MKERKRQAETVIRPTERKRERGDKVEKDDKEERIHEEGIGRRAGR